MCKCFGFAVHILIFVFVFVCYVLFVLVCEDGEGQGRADRAILGRAPRRPEEEATQVRSDGSVVGRIQSSTETAPRATGERDDLPQSVESDGFFVLHNQEVLSFLAIRIRSYTRDRKLSP